ncbi:hypothetical protein [Chryseobacterium sp. EO14]|uniref:hypothetical protein n=1 Tax=Chryseobacterium sp. EO14 TaxID=2950551 RepID=UPI00210E8A2F|nr:hypothetical protein [Chryseobacterium sp. EO14]MCQ4139534.1 hypothetical protein [Chryseobacterium sp. EO14]
MKNIFLILLILEINIMMAQNSFKVLTKEEEQANYSLRDLKFYKMSSYNESIAHFIDENNLLVQANDSGVEHSLILSISDFDNNKFPLLPENDTPYYRYREFMNKEGFTKENMLKMLNDLNFNYQPETFYTDAEKFVKKLSLDDKMKFIIPLQYFIGEDLHKLCPNAKWSFEIRRYFQPFFEPCLYYEKRNFDFYDMNLLLREKLFNNKKITFKHIYQKVEKKLMKDKELWWDFGNVKGD